MSLIMQPYVFIYLIRFATIKTFKTLFFLNKYCFSLLKNSQYSIDLSEITHLSDSYERGLTNIIRLFFNEPKYRTSKSQLHHSIKSGNISLVDLVCKYNIINKRQINNSIRLSAEYGHLHILKYFHNCNGELTSGSSFALRSASQNGHLNVVKYLCNDSSFDSHALNSSIILAAENKHYDIFNFLYKKDLYLCTKKRIIDIAIRVDNIQVVKFMHENAPDLFAMTKQMFLNAVHCCSLKIVEYIYSNILINTAFNDTSFVAVLTECAIYHKNINIYNYLKQKCCIGENTNYVPICRFNGCIQPYFFD